MKLFEIMILLFPQREVFQQVVSYDGGHGEGSSVAWAVGQVGWPYWSSLYLKPEGEPAFQRCRAAAMKVHGKCQILLLFPLAVHMSAAAHSVQTSVCVSPFCLSVHPSKKLLAEKNFWVNSVVNCWQVFRPSLLLSCLYLGYSRPLLLLSEVNVHGWLLTLGHRKAELPWSQCWS